MIELCPSKRTSERYLTLNFNGQITVGGLKPFSRDSNAKTLAAMLDDRNNKAYYNSFVDGHPTWRRWRQTIYAPRFPPLSRVRSFPPTWEEKSAIGYNVFIVQPDWAWFFIARKNYEIFAKKKTMKKVWKNWRKPFIERWMIRRSKFCVSSLLELL